jgi:hypothetical protein
VLVFSQFTNAAASHQFMVAAGWLALHLPATTLTIPRLVAFVIISCEAS